MSHSSGAVKFNDGEIWYYEYNGTVEFVIPHIYKNYKDMKEHWRDHEYKKCECGNKEKVEIYSDYGGGFYFPGYACRQCKSLDVEIGEDTYMRGIQMKLKKWLRVSVDGKPDWYNEIEWIEGDSDE